MTKSSSGFLLLDAIFGVLFLSLFLLLVTQTVRKTETLQRAQEQRHTEIDLIKSARNQVQHFSTATEAPTLLESPPKSTIQSDCTSLHDNPHEPTFLRCQIMFPDFPATHNNDKRQVYTWISK